MNKIRKGDEVIVTTGRDSGKRGIVLRVLSTDQLVVEGVGIVKKHAKPNPMKGVTGGIIELNAQYHFTDFGAFQPYVGGGPAYFHVFDTEDGSLSQFSVKDAFGFNVQIGADWMLSKNLGLFVDIKKVFLSTTSTGTHDFGGGTILPVNTDVRLDPTIISVGLTLRY
jgi:ribosomal protein L24